MAWRAPVLVSKAVENAANLNNSCFHEDPLRFLARQVMRQLQQPIHNHLRYILTYHLKKSSPLDGLNLGAKKFLPTVADDLAFGAPRSREKRARSGITRPGRSQNATQRMDKNIQQSSDLGEVLNFLAQAPCSGRCRGGPGCCVDPSRLLGGDEPDPGVGDGACAPTVTAQKDEAIARNTTGQLDLFRFECRGERWSCKVRFFDGVGCSSAYASA